MPRRSSPRSAWPRACASSSPARRCASASSSRSAPRPSSATRWRASRASRSQGTARASRPSTSPRAIVARHRERPARDLPARAVEAAGDPRRDRCPAWPIAIVRRFGRKPIAQPEARRERRRPPSSLRRDPLDAARAIARAVDAAGGRALIVGGWVRDRLLGRDAKDLDLEVYGLHPLRAQDAARPTFGPVNTVGESFTVYKVAGLDVSLPRRESKIGRGHKGFEVVGDPDPRSEGSGAAPRLHHQRDLVGSAARRPTSIRSTAATTSRDRVLRVVDPRTFGDDSLRVLRAMQFAARFECAARARTRRRSAAPSRSTICRPSASGARSRSCCCRRERPSIGLQLALRPRHRRRGCGRSCRRWSAARRIPSGTPKATSGCTR